MNRTGCYDRRNFSHKHKNTVRRFETEAFVGHQWFVTFAIRFYIRNDAVSELGRNPSFLWLKLVHITTPCGL